MASRQVRPSSWVINQIYLLISYFNATEKRTFQEKNVRNNEQSKIFAQYCFQILDEFMFIPIILTRPFHN
jgi:hypothetical protein